jgi:hypothetical protein
VVWGTDRYELVAPVPVARTGRELSLPLAGCLTFVSVRVTTLVVTALLLAHGRFARLHWSVGRWANSWDAQFYQKVATHGYGFRWPGARPLPHGSLYPWFPGYPAAIAALHWPLRIPPEAAALIVTAAAGIAAAWGLARLAMLVTGDRRVSLLAVALWAAAPGSVVFSMAYTETLYCALAIWALVLLLERRWLAAGALACAAGTVQLDGAAVTLAVAVAAAGPVIGAVRAGEPLARWWRPAAAVPLAASGWLGYLVFVAVRVHRWNGWFWIESAAWSQSFDFGRGVAKSFERVLAGSSSMGATLLVAMVAAALVLAAWTLAEPLPPVLALYTVAVVVLAAGSSSYFSSMPRFLLPAVTLAFPLARVLAQARARVLIPLLGVLAVASAWVGVYLTTVAWLPP